MAIDDKDRLVDGPRFLLDQSQKEEIPYVITVLGRIYDVLPGVFSPKYFTDTEIFAKCVPISIGQRFLEIGCGTGVISIEAAFRGARVVCVDINSRAVQNTLINIKRHDMVGKVDVREGSVFDSVSPDEKFEVIFWNTPFVISSDAKRGSDLTPLEKALYDPGYEAIRTYVREGASFLSPEGKQYLGFSSTLGKVEDLMAIVESEHKKLRLVHSEKDKDGVGFELYEILGSSAL